MAYAKVRITYRMYVPGAEAADRGILLSFLVKAYAEAELLPEKRGGCTPGMREKPRRKVLEAVRAIEMHMVLSCISMGILQSLSIRYIGKISSSQIRYQRTPSKGRVSEAALMP